MPPKAAPAPIVPEEKGLNISITVVQTDLQEGGSFSNCENCRIKIVSEWLNCCGTTGLFGSTEGGLAWQTSSESGVTNKRSATFKKSFKPFFDEKDPSYKEKISMLNLKPGIYFVILVDLVENLTYKQIPVKFSYMDCSSYLIEQTAKKLILSLSETVSIHVTVDIEKPILPYADALNHEPLVLDAKRLKCFPRHEAELVNESFNGVYLYGELNLGSPEPRTVISFPNLEESSVASFDLSICYLPGLYDIKRFKELLTFNTYVLEIHQEDVFKRAFHQRNVEEFNNLNVIAPAPPPDKAAAKPKGKAAPVPTEPAPVQVPQTATPFGAPTAADRFLLDAIARAMRASRSLRAHGAVRFRLEQLLSSSNDKLAMFDRKRHGRKEGDDNIVVKEKMSLEVRLEKAAKPEKWDIPADISLRNALERSLAEDMSRLDGTLATTKKTTKSSLPNRYELFITAGTTLEFAASLHRKLVTTPAAAAPLTDDALRARLAVTPFTRMVVVFKYLDDDTLFAIDRAVNRVNTKALPDIQGSIRSYSLTAAEEKMSADGTLDCISGFMIIDDDVRIVVLEGLAGVGQGMQSVYADMPRAKADDADLTILCNPEILFPTRLYPSFTPDLRRIRVRGKLKHLARSPEIYNRRQVDELPFAAIDKIMALHRATDMRSTKVRLTFIIESRRWRVDFRRCVFSLCNVFVSDIFSDVTVQELDMYPTAESLSNVELLYGEAITRTDMNGTLRKEYVENTDAVRTMIHSRRKFREEGKAAVDEAAAEAAALESKKPYERKRDEFEFTDCRNYDFEQHLRTRPVHRVDHLEENRKLRMQAYAEMLVRRDAQELKATQTLTTLLGTTSADPKIYLYSTQSLNFKALAMSKLREQVSDDREASYTFSKNFMSQTLAAVDEDEEKKKQIVNSKNHWLTPSGFQYPKRRTTKELITHPMRPSDARIDDLQDRYLDQTDVKKIHNSADPQLKAMELHFDTRGKADKEFGMLEPLQFSRPFELKLVGSRTKLPRGVVSEENLKSKDPNFFRSVHIGGEEKLKMLADAKVQEKEDWHKKVVVDHTDFKVGGFKVRDVTIQSDRTKGILKGEPKQLALKMLYDRESHTGKDISLKPMPVSIMTTDGYVENAAKNALLRRTDTTKFVTMQDLNSDDSKAQPEDFVRHIHTDARTSKMVKMISKSAKYVPPPLEKVGPKWG